MADKKYNTRSRKDFGEKSGLDRTKISGLYVEEMAKGEFKEDAARFEQDEDLAPTL